MDCNGTILPEPSVLRSLILQDFAKPVLFKRFIDDWKIVSWSLADWSNAMGSKCYPFRVGLSTQQELQWEAKCSVVNITMQQFVEEATVPLSQKQRWLYFDYKHMCEWFHDNQQIYEGVSWKNFGFPEKDSSHSTLWISSEGAYTPCHYDAYGGNLVAQIYGRKQWFLFPPEATEFMSPSRIPYEESSIYSMQNYAKPDAAMVSGLKGIRVVTLAPGDVLFVPRHWWHYVETAETAISVNTWIPLDDDNVSRLDESLVRFYITQLCKNIQYPKSILNPNEVDLVATPLSESSDLVKRSLEECKKKFQDIGPKRRKLDTIQHNLKNEESKPDPTNTQDMIASNLCEERINVLEFMERYKNFISIVEKSPTSVLSQILKRKSNLDATCGNAGECMAPTISSSEKLLKNISNAFCHPDVIALVRTKLQNMFE